MPSITPAGQEVEILDYLFRNHGVENVLLILGQAVWIDHRLEYALLRGLPNLPERKAIKKIEDSGLDEQQSSLAETKTNDDLKKLEQRHQMYSVAVRKLAILVSQCKGSQNIFIFLLKAFPDAMAHFNVNVQGQQSALAELMGLGGSKPPGSG